MGIGRKLIIAAASMPLALVVVYGVVSSYGLPRLARKAIADWQAQTPGIQIGLREISVNPWTWTLKAQGFDVRQAEQPLIHVDGLEIGLSFSSIANRAVVLREVAVHGVSLSLHWDSHGHLDIERILPHQRRARAANRSRPNILWQIDHLAVTDLRVQAVDPAVGLSDALDLSLPSLDLDHIGTLHGGDDKFSMDLHGRYGDKPVWDLHWQGDVDFAPLASTGHIQLAHLSLPWLGQSVGHRLPIELRQGQLDFETDYQLGELQGQQRLSVQKARLDIRQLDVTGKGRLAPEFLLQRLHVRAATIDMVRHQVLGDVFSMESPELIVHRNEDGQVDLTGLMHQLPESNAPRPATPSTPAWTVSWPLAEIRSAAIRFDDKSSRGFGDLRIPSVDLRVENLQTIDDSPLRVAARGEGLSAGQQSVALHWSLNGSLRPRSGALHLAWTLQDLDLGQLGALAHSAKLTVQQGQLAAQGMLDGDVHHPAQLVATGSAQVRQVDVLAPDWGEFRGEQVDVGPLKFADGQLHVHSIAAQALHVLQGERELDLERFGAGGITLDPDGPKVHLHQLQLSGLQWDGGASAIPRLSGKQGQVTLRGLAWNGADQRFRLDDLLFSKGGFGLRNATRHVHLGWQQIELHDLNADVAAQRVTLASLEGTEWFWKGSQPWVTLPAVNVRDVRCNLSKRHLALGTVGIDGGQAMLWRRKDGRIQPLVEMESMMPARAAPAPVTQSAARGDSAASAWGFALKSVAIGLRSVKFEDHQKQVPPVEVTDLTLQAGPWSSTGTRVLQEHLQLTFQGGQWQWDGTVNPHPVTADGQIGVQHVNLQSLQTFVAQRSYAGIDHCSVSASGKLNLRSDGGTYRLHYGGGLQIGDTRIVDTRNGQPVLSWNGVNVPQMTLDWPGGLQVPRVDLDGLYARIAIQQDRRVNWESLVRPAAGASVQASPAKDKAATATWPVHVDQVSLTEGSADFADESLRTPFAAKIHAMAGDVGPFASDAPEAWTNMRLKGGVNEGGHVDVTGRIMPLSKPLRLDAGLHFRDIELPTLNPYAAEFAGYRIDQGKLDLQLQYTLDQGLIQGSNRARIDQLVLGPQIRTDGVPDLPLHLIIDILRNDDGVIDLDVPVQGDLNKPSVTLRDIAFAALEGALRDIAESPFRLLENLLGSDADTLRHIGFVPGAADLSAHDEAKLQSIAKVLGQHQKMVISIRPSYNPDADKPEAQHSAGATAQAAAAPTAESDRLRALALQRAEAIREVLTKSGIHNRRIFIDEPSSVTTLGKAGAVLTTLDLKVP